MKRLIARTSCLIGLAVLQTGCLGTALSTLDDMTAGMNQRIAMHQNAVQVFHKGVSWGAPETVSKYVSPRIISTFAKKFPGYSDKEKLVGIEVDEIAYEEDAKTAYVDVTIKYFRKPAYVVDTKKQSEKWEFRSMDGGWLLTDAQSATTAATVAARVEKNRSSESDGNDTQG